MDRVKGDEAAEGALKKWRKSMRKQASNRRSFKKPTAVVGSAGDSDSEDGEGDLTRALQSVGYLEITTSEPDTACKSIALEMRPKIPATEDAEQRAFMKRLSAEAVWTCMGEVLDGQRMLHVFNAVVDPFCHLSEIRLFRNGLTRSMVTALVNALGRNNSLSHVVVRDNNIDDEACRRIAEMFRQAGASTPIRSLSLRDNHIGDDGAAELASILKLDATPLEYELHHALSRPPLLAHIARVSLHITSSEKQGHPHAHTLCPRQQ